MYLKRLRELREYNDYTQEYVAYKLKIKQQQYYRYEAGKRDLPIKYIKPLCRLYNTTPNYLLEYDQNK